MSKILQLLLHKYQGLYHLSVKKNQIIIEVSELAVAEKISEQLKSSLASAHTFYASLPFEVKIGDVKLGQSKIEHLNYPGSIPPENSIEGVRQIFSNFFGEAFEDAGFDPNLFFGSKAIIKDGVLFSKPAKFKGIESTWGVFFDWLVLHFDGADLETLRAAWRGEKALTEPTQTTEKTTAKGLIQQCFGVQKVDGKTIAYFNYKRLYEFLFPPSIKITPQDDCKKYQIEIDQKHLMTYMKQLNERGILLHVFRPDEKSTPVVQPLFIGLEETVEKSPLYVLMIDRSGSMSHDFESLKDYVLEFANKLREENPDAKLRIVFFDDTVGPIKDFDIQEEKTIEAFLKNTPLGGTTNILGTVATELEWSFTQADSQNVVLMLFTDGVDNVNGKKEKTEFNEKIALNAKKANAPQFHTYGYGNYDHQTLSDLALKMHGSFVHLTSFEQLNNALKLTGHHTKKSRILVDLRVLFADGKMNAYKVPLYADGGTQAPDLFIPLTKSSVEFQVNGQSMLVTVPDTANIPLGTTIDTLAVLASNARHLVSDRRIIFRDKLSQLQDFLLKLSQLPTVSVTENEAKQMVEEELKEYQYGLSNGQDDSAILESIYTRAELRTNLIKTDEEDIFLEQKQVFANEPKDIGNNPLPGVEVIYDHSGREYSAIQQAVSYQAVKKVHGFFSDAHKGLSSFCEQAVLPEINQTHAESQCDQLSSEQEHSIVLYQDPQQMPKNDFLFDQGAWDSEVDIHPTTGEPIFHYRVYKSGVESGSISLYKHPLLCRSEEGDRHNIIALHGVFSVYDIEGKLHTIEDICTALPPTLLEQLTKTAYKGAQQGGLHGVANVISYTLDVKGFSKKVSQRACTRRFITEACLHFNMPTTAMHWLHKIYPKHKKYQPRLSAMWGYGIVALTHIVLNCGSQLMGWTGEKACQNGWNSTGQSLQWLASSGSYCVYAYQSYIQGPCLR